MHLTDRSIRDTSVCGGGGVKASLDTFMCCLEVLGSLNLPQPPRPVQVGIPSIVFVTLDNH